MMSQVPTLPALGERCSVLDTVSKRARTPLRSPICVRGQKCLLVDNALEMKLPASDMCESSVTSKSHGRVCRLIDLVLSSSIEDTVRVVDETDALRTLVSSTRPLSSGTRGRDGCMTSAGDESFVIIHVTHQQKTFSL